MVSSVIKPEGTNRPAEFSRTNEFVFFAMFGDARVMPTRDDYVGSRLSWQRKPPLNGGTSGGVKTQTSDLHDPTSSTPCS